MSDYIRIWHVGVGEDRETYVARDIWVNGKAHPEHAIWDPDKGIVWIPHREGSKISPYTGDIDMVRVVT